MLLWIAFAVLTASVVFAVTFPLWRKRANEVSQIHDVIIYKQQLEGLEAERATGLLAESEIEAARGEVSRRLITATEKPVSSSASSVGQRERFVVAAVAGVMLILSAALYSLIPHLEHSVTGWFSRGNQLLREGKGFQQLQANEHWSVSQIVYGLATEKSYRGAERAFRKVLELSGENASVLTRYGATLVHLNGGRIAPAFQRVFKRAVELNPKETGAIFWLAQAAEQDQRWDKAILLYKRLLNSDLSEQHKKPVHQRLAALEKRQNPNASGQSTTAKSVTTSETRSNASIPPIVTNLAKRLQKDKTDLNGWVMLIRTYMTLGRRDEAKKAMQQARINFRGNKEGISLLDALEKKYSLK
jgi:cytochrome c-type biogenesis protein CcmH